MNRLFSRSTRAMADSSRESRASTEKCICLRQGVLDLLGPGDALVGLVELAALTRRLEMVRTLNAAMARNSSVTTRNAAISLCVERGADAGEPANQATYRCPGEHDGGDRFELDLGCSTAMAECGDTTLRARIVEQGTAS